MIVGLNQIFLLSGILFAIGIVTLLTRRNLIMMLLGVEIMLNGVAISFVGAALKWGDLEGQALVLFIIAVAAVEVSVGLAFIVRAHRRADTVDPNILGAEDD